MKKIVLMASCFIAGMAIHLNAQVAFSENFSSVTAPALPAGWNQVNVDGQTVNSNVTLSFGSNAWITYLFPSGPHGNAAVSTSYFVNPTPAADRWIISPAINLGTNDYLIWSAMAGDPTYRDGYEVRISTTGNAVANFTTAPLLTVAAENNAWTQHALNLSAYNGQTVYIAWRNTSTNDYLLFVDDISVETLPANDIALTAVTPTSGSQAAIGAVAAPITIGGTIQNMGNTNITTFTARYNDGTSTYSCTFSSLNVAPFATYNFSCTTPYSIPASDIYKMKVWADLTGDVNHANDTSGTHVIGYSFLPTHRVVFEECTGTWCGWCPRGAVYMDSMYIMNRNTTVEIAVHNSDPMTDAPYDAALSAMIGGFPSILVDRAYIDDPSNAFVQYSAHINDFAMADLTIAPTYNSISRVATVAVTAKMASTFTNNNTDNDYRLAVVFTEMGVTGTTSAYDQHDYYSYQSNNLPLSGAGHNWQNETNPVSHTKMVFDFVDRTIDGGVTGLAASLPNTIVAGQTYNQTFNYTIPAAYNASNMKVHALLIDANNNVIYNGISSDLALGMNEIVQGKQEFSVYPNPANDVLNMNLKMNDADNEVVVTFMNFLGQVVMSQNIGKVAGGQSTYSFDVSNLPSGAYFVNVSTSKGVASSKFIK
jgi:hypothetical protein